MKLLKNNNFGSKFSDVIEKFFGGSKNISANDEFYLPGVPAVNISADSKQIDISLVVPGLDRKDLNVEIEGNNLMIKCEKEFEITKVQRGKTLPKNLICEECEYAGFEVIPLIPLSLIDCFNSPDSIMSRLRLSIQIL